MYSAGILPYTIINKDIYILLGRESYDKTYSDFGGKYDSSDTSVFQTAYREFQEESLYNSFSYESLLSKDMIYTESRTLRGHIYYMFLMKLDPEQIYDIIQNFGNRLTKSHRITEGYKNIYEKDHLKLCKLKDVMNLILTKTTGSGLGHQIPLRKVFRSTLMSHLTFFQTFECFQRGE